MILNMEIKKMTTLTEEAQNFIEVEQKESLKIIKNTKGWNYEYKLLGTVEEQILRIDNIENILKSKFENGGEKNCNAN